MANLENSLIIKNCNLLTSLQRDELIDITIRDGKIAWLGKTLPQTPELPAFDAEGCFVAPGFIDIHIQGAGGADILDGTLEALRTISRTIARFGVTGFLATTVYRTRGNNNHLRIAAEAKGEELGGARLLGIHIEGPFISPEMRGMILPGCITAPSKRVLDEILELTGSSLKIMTIAPELDGSLEIITSLRDLGVIPSFGHSNATYEETIKGIDAGISHVTHLFNAMTSFHHRAPGPLPAILESKSISVQVIGDGVHIHPGVLKLAFNLFGEQRCIPITDGMQAMGLEDGIYTYNGTEYEARGGVARYRDGKLIGTAVGMNEILKRITLYTDLPISSIVKTASLNPSRLLRLEDRKGSIEAGKEGDLVVFDEKLSIRATIVKGRIVYSAK